MRLAPSETAALAWRAAMDASPWLSLTSSVMLSAIWALLWIYSIASRAPFAMEVPTLAMSPVSGRMSATLTEPVPATWLSAGRSPIFRVVTLFGPNEKFEHPAMSAARPAPAPANTARRPILCPGPRVCVLLFATGSPLALTPLPPLTLNGPKPKLYKTKPDA